ncbi:MAG TPA: prepilin peptidase [Syntrophorhabdaceae bacterium]|jgi:leader peptidase (prepilin peptidase)/N-methyltransferase
MHVLIAIGFILLGAVIGSFLNVCIYRLPRERSIVSPPSACPECGKPIRFYDNIPVLSYLLLKGKCRDCGAPISARYPMVEAVTAAFFFLLYMKLGLTLETVVFLLFVSALIAISFIDLELRIIPDVLSIGGVIVGFLFSLARPFFRDMDPKFGILDSLYGILLGGGILFGIAWTYQLLTKREGMGGGDIKLLAMIGAFCGMKGVVFSLMAGSILGTAVGVPLMLVKGKDGKYAIPFGPFLSLGALVYVYAGDRIIDPFLRFLEST